MKAKRLLLKGFAYSLFLVVEAPPAQSGVLCASFKKEEIPPHIFLINFLNLK